MDPSSCIITKLRFGFLVEITVVLSSSLCSHYLMISGRIGYQWTSFNCLKQLECLSMTVRHSTRVYCGARLIYHFYPGCMIVELLDYRPQRNKEPTLEKPERTRAVLHPNAETLWADICSLNQKYGGNWSDEEALELEARLLVSIHPKSRH